MGEKRNKEVQMLSMLGQRGTLGMTLADLGERDKRIVALSADLRNTSGLDRFAAAFPDRFYNTGIAEQALVGVSAGLASAGYVPFCSSFANFSALRANEFVRHFLSYMQENVKLVGMAAGFSMGMFGTTHYGLEDVAALRSFPNLLILSPADCLETKKAVIAAAEYQGPVYLRLYGEARQPVVYQEDFPFRIGKANLLRDGSDVALLATGGVVYQSLAAAVALEQQGVYAQVWDVSTLSQIDLDAVEQACQTKLIFTVEEHRMTGGLGSAVAEVLSEQLRHPPLVRLGVPLQFDKSGTNTYCLRYYGLDSEGIQSAVLKNINLV